MTTDTRQLRLTISGILESFEINNLQLEIQLSEAVRRYFEGTARAGSDPVKVRKDILSAMIEMALDSQKYDEMCERVEKALKVRPDGGENWKEIIRYLLKQDEQGKTIEKFAEWCKNDPFNSPKSHQIALKPGIIRATWPGAFMPTAKEIKQSFDPFESLINYMQR